VVDVADATVVVGATEEVEVVEVVGLDEIVKEIVLAVADA
jgi:hypothetical protein